MNPDMNDDEYDFHLHVKYDDDDVKYDDDKNCDEFHCMSAAEMKEVYDSYEDYSEPRFQLYGPRAGVADTEVAVSVLDSTMDHELGYYRRNQNADFHSLRDDPIEYSNVTLTEIEQYNIDRQKHVDDKKSLDVLKTMKSMYELQLFVDTYSNALETVRVFFYRYSKLLSQEEKRWARVEIEYMKELRQSLQDLHNKIYNDHKTQIDVQQAQIMQWVQFEDNQRRRLVEIKRSADMSESAISELSKKTHLRVLQTDTVDRKNVEKMDVLMQEMNTFLSKQANKIIEDMAWKSKVNEFVKFLDYRKKRSRLDVWKLEINVMQIENLSQYEDAYSSVLKDVDTYLSGPGNESLKDEEWKQTEIYYGEYIARVKSLHIQVESLSKTKRLKKEAFKSTEQILMKIDCMENELKFNVIRSQISWQNEKEYMDYLKNLAILEEHSDMDNTTKTQISQDIKIYEIKNEKRVVFENRV